MRKFLLVIVFVSLKTTMFAQSVYLKDYFQNIQSMFTEYNWKSPSTYLDHSNYTGTIIHSVSFVYPNLIINLTDKYIRSGCSTSAVSESSLGTKTIKIPINSSMTISDYKITFKNNDGIEVTMNNKKSLKTEFFFTSDKLVLEKLSYHLTQFINKLKSEAFTGSLGIQNKHLPRKDKTRNTKKSNASKSGKYVQ